MSRLMTCRPASKFFHNGLVFRSKHRHWPLVITAMDPLGHADYPVPPSVQENFATVPIHQRSSFDQHHGFGTHREPLGSPTPKASIDA
jgi:hypothetical protein